MASLAVALFSRFGLSLAFFLSFVFVAGLIVITFIDLEVRIVPDVISLPGIVIGLISSIVHHLGSMDHSSFIPSPASSFFGLILGGGILLIIAWCYQFMTGKEGMGGGDIKLLAMIGAFLGWPSVPVTLFFASLSGSVVGVALMLLKGVNSKYALPFAPFLCLGAVFYLFFGKEAISFYHLYAWTI